jgi:general secretion pathway protein K
VTIVKRHDGGFALLAVLWLVAALSIMLTGTLHVIRSEVAIATQVRNGLVDGALADAAIRQTLQELNNNKIASLKSIQRRDFTLFTRDIHVEVTPLNGSIDLNAASLELLADAFEFGAQLPRQEAQRLAGAAIDYRNRKGSQGQPLRFHSTEDLLNLPGLGYGIYAKLKSCITVDITGSGRVNPLAASAKTLAILAKGDESIARQLAASLLVDADNIDITRLTANHIDMAPTSYLTIRANVKTDDNAKAEKLWRVDVGGPSYGLPWRTLAIEKNPADGSNLN